MSEKKNLLTYEGLKKLEDELQDLKVVQRKEIAQKIKEAREQGDLSENAEYDAAKDEQRKGREFSEAEGTLRREAEDLRGCRGIELFRPEKWRGRSGSVPGEPISEGAGGGLEGVPRGRLGGMQEAL